MRIARYIAEHKVAFLIVVLCYVLQSVCDLALPYYTSNIVDVGIQQSGIESAVASAYTEETFDAVLALSSDEDGAVLQAAYTHEGDRYVLGDVTDEQRAQLDGILQKPVAFVYYARQMMPSEGAVGAAAEGAATEGAAAPSTATYAAPPSPAAPTSLDKDAAREMMDEVLAPYAVMGDSILSQAATSQVKLEYEALGIDVADIQMDYLKFMGLSMLGIALFAFLIHCVMNFFACRTSMKIGRDLRERFFTRVMSFSANEVDRFSSASLITRGTNDIQQIQMMCLIGQRMVVYTPIICIGGIIMVTQLNVSMGWIIALAVVLIVIFVAILFAVTMPKFKIMQQLIDRVNLVAREMLTGVPVVRAFNRQDYEHKRFDGANTDLYKTQLFTNRAMAFLGPIMTLVMNGAAVLIVWVGGHYIDMGTVQTGDLIAFITYAMIIVSSFLIIGAIAIFMPRANVAAARVDEVIETASSIRDALKVYDEELPTDAAGVRVEFQNVGFGYGGGVERVIEDVSFVAEAGKTTAIIGSTGSGKSTLIKLIERFYDVNEGAVLVDGVDVRDLSLDALRGSFGYVPQASFLFAGTIESNVGYGQDADDPATIEQALQIAQAADFVASKPEGLETPISQGGTNVSGGQRQRLAIARAIATDARGYLFDDSFSALDYKTDSLLRADLRTKLAGKTVIIVAQRVATIMNADRIIVLDEGRVVGQGTHAQLLRECPVYYEIASSQLSEEELAKGGDR